MMHISMILHPDTCIHDAGFFPDERTNEQGDSRSWIESSFTKGESMQMFFNSRASNTQANYYERESMQTFKEFVHISFSRSRKVRRMSSKLTIADLRPCNLCPKTFASSGSLFNHEQTHTEGKSISVDSVTNPSDNLVT